MSGQLTPSSLLVSSVGSARDANHVLGAAKIDLAIVDGFLADRDGESWIAAQRKAGNRSLRILFVSAFADHAKDPATQRLTKELGVEHVLQKPVDPRRIQRLVETMLARTRTPIAEQLSIMRRTFGADLPHKLAGIATTIALVRSTRSPRQVQEARRLAHSLEGTAGSHGFPAVGHAAGRVSALLAASVPPWDAIDASLTDLRTRIDSAQAHAAA